MDVQAQLSKSLWHYRPGSSPGPKRTFLSDILPGDYSKKRRNLVSLQGELLGFKDFMKLLSLNDLFDPEFPFWLHSFMTIFQNIRILK